MQNLNKLYIISSILIKSKTIEIRVDVLKIGSKINGAVKNGFKI